ncbi:hypothetical protein CLAIMM_06730 [Cladophialophora immunda]|nr:hypothetical protein CLAIMM_06730 [Cladophialophora immunda]
MKSTSWLTWRPLTKLTLPHDTRSPRPRLNQTYLVHLDDGEVGGTDVYHRHKSGTCAFRDPWKPPIHRGPLAMFVASVIHDGLYCWTVFGSLRSLLWLTVFRHNKADFDLDTFFPTRTEPASSGENPLTFVV